MHHRAVNQGGTAWNVLATHRNNVHSAHTHGRRNHQCHTPGKELAMLPNCPLAALSHQSQKLGDDWNKSNYKRRVAYSAEVFVY